MGQVISRSCMLALVPGIGALLLSISPACATVVSGSSLAFGEGLDAGIAVTSGPLPLLSAAAPAPYNTASELLSGNVPNVLTTGPLAVNIRSDVDGAVGPKISVASATVNKLSLAVGSLTLALTTISSQASVSGDYGALAAAGGTTVSGLVINGVPIITATLPPNDVLLNAPDLTITLNKQAVGGDGVASRSLQVRGLDIAFNGFADGANLLSGDIVIGESTVREAAQAPSPVPEPASLAMVGLSLGALTFIRRRLR
jgi:hypothetical protein